MMDSGIRTGARVFEALVEAIDRPYSKEADALEDYARIAPASGDPMLAFVIEMVLDEALRDQHLLKSIVTTMRDRLNWTHSEGGLPPGNAPAAPAAPLVASLRRARIHERAAAREVRELARRCTGINRGLDSVLLETIARHSDERAQQFHFLLESVRDHSAPRSSPAHLLTRIVTSRLTTEA